jgi:hypothetical protein
MTYLAKLRRLTDFEKTLGRLYMTVLDFSLLQSMTMGTLNIIPYVDMFCASVVRPVMGECNSGL